jgi:hypothetical protein
VGEGEEDHDDGTRKSSSREKQELLSVEKSKRVNNGCHE